MPELCFIDTETTGTDPQDCALVEVGALLSDGKEFERLVDPEREIPPEASAVHNITNRMIQGKPCAAEVMPDFVLFTAQVRYFVAHNAPYDRAVLKRHFPMMQDAPWIDTLRWSRHLYPDIPSHRIQVLRYRFDLAIDGLEAHRAMADVLLLKSLYDHLTAETVKRYGTFTTKDLIAAIERPIPVHVFYFGKYRDRPVEEVYREDWEYCKWLMRQGWFGAGHPDLFYTISSLALGKSLDQIAADFL